MKRTVVTVLCSVLATLMVVGVLQWSIREVMEGKETAHNWKDSFELRDSMTCKGRIVYIAPDDVHGGTILYLDTDWNMSEELVQVWVYEDTVLSGELNGRTMQQLLDERTVGMDVETVLFPFRTDIIENTRLYPAMHVSVLAEDA